MTFPSRLGVVSFTAAPSCGPVAFTSSSARFGPSGPLTYAKQSLCHQHHWNRADALEPGEARSIRYAFGTRCWPGAQNPDAAFGRRARRAIALGGDQAVARTWSSSGSPLMSCPSRDVAASPGMHAAGTELPAVVIEHKKNGFPCNA